MSTVWVLKTTNSTSTTVTNSSSGERERAADRPAGVPRRLRRRRARGRPGRWTRTGGGRRALSRASGPPRVGSEPGAPAGRGSGVVTPRVCLPGRSRRRSARRGVTGARRARSPPAGSSARRPRRPVPPRRPATPGRPAAPSRAERLRVAVRTGVLLVGIVMPRVCDDAAATATGSRGRGQLRRSVGEGGAGLVAGVALRPLALLHPRLVDVPVAVGQLVAGALVEGAEGRPVVRVEVLDDLERPPVGDRRCGRPGRGRGRRRGRRGPASRSSSTASWSRRSALPVSWWKP